MTIVMECNFISRITASVTQPLTRIQIQQPN